jgi:hypothetical protein
MPITSAAAEFAESAEAVKHEELEIIQARCTARARKILEALGRTNPHQQALAVDPNPRVGGICPRRSGKTYGGAATALITCEAKPGAIVVVICLTLKQLRRNWWLGATSGITNLAQKYGIPISTNSSELRWEHENGSIGYLLGAESLEQMEYLRGMEADLYIIDEAGSFAPMVLQHLLDDILEPQRASRRGRIMMIGTPSAVISGPYYEGSNLDWVKRDDAGNIIKHGCLLTDQEPELGFTRRDYVSLHKWTMEDNGAQPWLWEEAQAFRKLKGWAEDHPTWRREYKGEWVNDGTGLVYRYLASKNEGKAVNWEPVRTMANPTGLPQELGPWHLVFGLDLGFEDPTALVVAAYSETAQELRHVWDYTEEHLLEPDVRALLDRTIRRFGMPDMIFADTSNLSKMLVETFRQRYGYPVERAERAEKNDHIELLNADLVTGKVKVIAGTNLETQLASVPWDLSKGDKKELAHKGKLVEDKKVPNDLTDAFLYLYRGCLHHFARSVEKGPEPGTPEWEETREKKALARARAQLKVEARLKANKLDRHRGPLLDETPHGWGRTQPKQPRNPWAQWS